MPPCFNLLHLTLNMTLNMTFPAAMLIRILSEVLGCNDKFKYKLDPRDHHFYCVANWRSLP
jgi:hypothetical protein